MVFAVARHIDTRHNTFFYVYDRCHIVDNKNAYHNVTPSNMRAY